MKVNIPASKSYAQRAIACAMLAKGRSTLCSVDMCDDIRAALGVARSFGAKVELDGRTVYIDGTLQLSGGTICTKESGLSTRLFSAIAALASTPVTITGHSTLLSRPMDMVEEAISKLGVKIESNNHLLPLKITGGAIEGGTTIEIDGSTSSQLLTGVLIALPRAKRTTVVAVDSLSSKPYIDITLDILSKFGIEVQNDNYERFTVVAPQNYKATNYTIEGDWSGASYFYVASRIWGLPIEIDNLNHNSVQGDKAIITALELCRDDSPIEFDATQCPDLFPSLVALCAFLSGTSHIKGLSRLKHKESDRGVVLKNEFAKLGVEIDIESQADTMIIHGIKDREIEQTAPINPHGDHRIAMATAIMGTNIEIEHPEVVKKSFEGFWTEWCRFKSQIKAR